MDIWDWVFDAQRELRASGQERLADIVDQVPPLAADGQHEQVEAMVPEGIALARTIEHPWIELFLRHWLAQSRIICRGDVTTGMNEVVRLLDFAHEDFTRDCPQSVCVTQDFCVAHSVLDALGYAEERLAACEESLGRISPAWPCFGCISTEYFNALFDLGRYSEAEAFSARHIAAMKPSSHARNYLMVQRAQALSALDRHEESLQVILSVKVSGHGRKLKAFHAISLAREYAHARRFDEAKQALPNPRKIDPGDYRDWIGAKRSICAGQPESNDAELERTLRGFLDTLQANGALYWRASVAASAARFALERGDSTAFASHIGSLRGALPLLRKPERLADELATMIASTTVD